MVNPLFDQHLNEPHDHTSPASASWDQRIRAELQKGEKIVWVGQPRPDLFMRQARPEVLFGLFWIAMTLLLLAIFLAIATSPGAQVDGSPLAAWIVLASSLLAGFGFLTVPFWKRHRARHIYYVLTDRRAILFETRWSGGVEVRSYGSEKLSRTYRVEYHGGGDIVFEEQFSTPCEDEIILVETPRRHGFFGIADVHRVESLLRTTLLTDTD